jgi:hypothetical protein
MLLIEPNKNQKRKICMETIMTVLKDCTEYGQKNVLRKTYVYRALVKFGINSIKL